MPKYNNNRRSFKCYPKNILINNSNKNYKLKLHIVSIKPNTIKSFSIIPIKTKFINPKAKINLDNLIIGKTIKSIFKKYYKTNKNCKLLIPLIKYILKILHILIPNKFLINNIKTVQEDLETLQN